MSELKQYWREWSNKVHFYLKLKILSFLFFVFATFFCSINAVKGTLSTKFQYSNLTRFQD